MTANRPRKAWTERLRLGSLGRLQAAARRLERRFPHPRLPLEPLPSSCWLSEIGDYLAGTELDRVRLAALTETAARCTFCGYQPPELGSLRIRSRWAFDDRTLTQTLLQVTAICEHCDDARSRLGQGDPKTSDSRQALAHLAQLNHWTLDLATAYAHDVQSLAQLRSAQDWSLDLTWLRSIDVVVPGLDSRIDLDQTYLPAHGFSGLGSAPPDLSVQLSRRPGPAPPSRTPRFPGTNPEDAHAYARTERVPLEIDLASLAATTGPQVPDTLEPQFAALAQDSQELWERFTRELGTPSRFAEATSFVDGALPIWKLWAYLEPRATLEPAFLIHLFVRAAQRALTALLMPWRASEANFRTNLPPEAQRILPGLPIWRDSFFLYETARFRSTQDNRPAVRLVTGIWRLPPAARRLLRDLRRLDAERLRLCGDSVDLEIRTRFGLLLPGSLHETAERRATDGRTPAAAPSLLAAPVPNAPTAPGRHQ